MAEHVAGTIAALDRLTDDDLDLGAVGKISTDRFAEVRYSIGHEHGDVFGLDCGYEGPTLTMEVADMADAVAMLRAIASAQGQDEPVAEAELDEAWKSGFNAGFGDAMLTKYAPAVSLPDDAAEQVKDLRSHYSIKGTCRLMDEAADTIEAQAAENARLTSALADTIKKWSKSQDAQIDALDRLEQAEADVARLKSAIMALVPSYRSPEEMCWCPQHRNLAFGHLPPCKEARAALSPADSKEG